MPPRHGPIACWREKAGAWWRGSCSVEALAPTDAWRPASRPAWQGVGRSRWSALGGSRQVAQRVHRLAVEADFEVQHVALGAAVAHLGDLLACLDQLPFVDQPRAVVAVGGQPRVVVLDDDQLAVSDQAGTGIHHDAVCRGADGLSRLAGDVDALAGRLTGHVTRGNRSVGRP